jgi:hypothetical protein
MLLKHFISTDAHKICGFSGDGKKPEDTPAALNDEN